MCFFSKKPLVLWCCLLVSAASSFLFADSSPLSRGPYLQLGNTNEMTIMLCTLSNSACTIEYGMSTNYSHTLISGNQSLHRVVLSNLLQNSRYYYRVSCGAAMQAGSFRTYPAGSEPVVFAAVGDTRNNFSNDAYYIRERNRSLAEWQALYQPYFLLNNGDLVFAADPLTNIAWQETFDDFSPLLRQSPLYIATGNHELNLYTGEICPGYFDYFSFPTNGPTPERIYSFDCGQIHVVVGEVHNAVTVSNESYYCPGSPQFTWITNDLARTSKPWKIVMTHCPVYSSGETYGTWGYKNQQSTNLVKYYVPEFKKYDVNLHIAGHEHLYERCQKNDTTYLTVSTWDDSYAYRFTNFPYSISSSPFGGAVFAVTNELMYVTTAVAGSNEINFVDYFVITNQVIPEPGIALTALGVVCIYAIMRRRSVPVF